MINDKATHDPSFPTLHIRPPSGWMNDPNGVSLIDGRYHVLFQYNPHSPQPPAIQWGHASSTDLITWDHHPVALVDRPGMIDAAGCWSGCVVDDHGVPTAVYSAIPDSPDHASVVLARSDRTMINWQQDERPVAGPPTRPGVIEARDPYVFSHQGRRFAIQGAGGRGCEPVILLYSCDDLTEWTELDPLLDYGDPVARGVAPAETWECPNLFPLDGRWVLLVSTWGEPGLDNSSYLIGDLQPSGEGLRFVAETGGRLDQDTSFYAPQALVTDDRVLLWGWAREGERPPELADSDWTGVLTFPRELGITDGVLHSRPAEEIAELRAARLPADQPITAAAFEIHAPDGISLRLAADGDQDPLTIDGDVRLLVDGSLIEAFPSGGSPITARRYPTDRSGWIADGPGLTVVELAATRSAG